VRERLHECDRRVVEQRGDQPGDPFGLEAGDVAVDPDDDVAVAGEQARPQHVALPVSVAVLEVDLLDRDHQRSGAGRHPGGVVGAAVVDDDELVDQRHALHQLVADRGAELPDRGRLVTARDAHRHRLAALGIGHLADRARGELDVTHAFRAPLRRFRAHR
jgi:hypothetical protein